MIEFTNSNISKEVLVVLNNMTYLEESEVLQLGPEKLDTSVYQSVKAIISSINGEWRGGNTQGFKFKYNPTAVLDEVIRVGRTPKINPTAFFPTPVDVIKHMLSTTAIEDYNANEPEFRVLEPSAGTGAIAKEVRKIVPNATIDTVEFLEINQEILKSEGFDPFCGDFMEYNVDAAIKYDVIYMNPPFSLRNDKHAYITHINHAKTMLKEGGKIWAIVPTGFMSNKSKKERAFHDDVMDERSFYDLPKGTFKEAGTMVETMVVCVSNDPWKKNPYKRYGEGEQFANYHVWEFGLNIDNYCGLSRKQEALMEKMKNKGEFDKDTYSAFVKNAFDIFRKDYIHYPYREIENFIKRGKDLVIPQIKEDLDSFEYIQITGIYETKKASVGVQKTLF